MTFGEKIREARKSKKLTQRQLSEKIGAAHNSVSDWENDKNKPDPDTIELLCGVLEITPNYLLASAPEEFTPYEVLLIKKYRSLDQPGREHVDTVIQWESARVEQIADLENQIGIADPAPTARTCSRIYPYMHKIAAAGIGFYFDDIPTDTLEAPYRDDADFIIGVNGDSMEPTYYDGDLVYVQKRQVVEPGDIGIFIVDGECYIKEAGEEGLISHNPKYKPISGGKEINCVGKVLGKVTKQ